MDVELKTRPPPSADKSETAAEHFGYGADDSDSDWHKTGFLQEKLAYKAV